jgi:probable rRNA maturation factor
MGTETSSHRDLEVFVADEQSQRPVDTATWARLARAVLEEEGVGAELSVMFVSEEAMAALNRQFLGGEGATDVLAFPIDDEPYGPGRAPDAGGTGPGWVPPEPDEVPDLLGDVVICPEVAWRQAAARRTSYEDELALLVVHGILHLVGMDHEEEPDASAMVAREQQLLGRHWHRRPGGGPPQG